jgi:hypothetical protein
MSHFTTPFVVTGVRITSGELPAIVYLPLKLGIIYLTPETIG